MSDMDLLPIQGPSVEWKVTDLGDPMVFIKLGGFELSLCPLQAVELAGTLIELGLEAHEFSVENDCSSKVDKKCT